METIGTISGGPDETSAEAAAPTGPVDVDRPDVSVGLGVSTDVPVVTYVPVVSVDIEEVSVRMNGGPG